MADWAVIFWFVQQLIKETSNKYTYELVWNRETVHFLHYDLTTALLGYRKYKYSSKIDPGIPLKSY